jgi:hypothetical protein
MKKNEFKTLVKESIREGLNEGTQIPKAQLKGSAMGAKAFKVIKPQLNAYKDKNEMIIFARALLIKLQLELEKEIGIKL